jgi:hypothetical protein
VLYEIPDYLIARETAKAHRRRSLDAIEGEGTNYTREKIKVRRPNGAIVVTLTYTVITPKCGQKTNVDYVCHIVSGLREHSLGGNKVPDEYIAKVKSIAATNNPDIAAEVEKL